VKVAIRKAPLVKLVHIKAFLTKASAKTLYVFRQLQHPNIVTALKAFTTDNGLYIVLEHMPVSLERIVRSLAYPDERQLTAILGQVSFCNLFQEHTLITTGCGWRGLPHNRRI
jgi:serine/threonine protein kinase